MSTTCRPDSTFESKFSGDFLLLINLLLKLYLLIVSIFQDILGTIQKSMKKSRYRKFSLIQNFHIAIDITYDLSPCKFQGQMKS